MLARKYAISATILILVMLGMAFLVYGLRENIWSRSDGPSRSISYRTIAQGQLGGGGSYSFSIGKTNFAINDNSTWIQLWTRLMCYPDYTGSLSCSPRPSLNFTSETVLGMSAGVEPHSGYQLNITAVTTTDTMILVHATLREPQDTCIELQSLIEPYHIVSIPKTSLPVTFETQNEEITCP